MKCPLCGSPMNMMRDTKRNTLHECSNVHYRARLDKTKAQKLIKWRIVYNQWVLYGYVKQRRVVVYRRSWFNSSDPLMTLHDIHAKPSKALLIRVKGLLSKG